MNGQPVSESGDSGLNVHNWVSAIPKLAAPTDQVPPFASCTLNGSYCQTSHSLSVEAPDSNVPQLPPFGPLTEQPESRHPSR